MRRNMNLAKTNLQIANDIQLIQLMYQDTYK